MSGVVFFMENYQAGGLDRVCRELLLNIKADRIYLLINKSIDEHILKTNELPDRIIIKKYKLPTTVDVTNYAQKQKGAPAFLFFKSIDYLLRYPLVVVSYVYFLFILRKLNYTKFITHNGGYPAALYCGTAALASAFILKEKSIYVYHSMPRKYSLMYVGFDFLWDKLLDRYCRFVAVSQKSAEELSAVRRIKQSPLVIHNGIDKAQQKQYHHHAVLKIISVGVISPFKNQIMLLKALDILVNKDGVKVYVCFVGKVSDEEYFKVLNDYVNTHKLNDYVNFEGFKANVNDYYYESDLLVSTSKIESFPMIILEAMRIGLPVLSTKVGGVSEQIEDGYDGFLVADDDHHLLSNRIKKCLEDGFIKKMGENAFNSFSVKFSKMKMVDRYNQLLELEGNKLEILKNN